MTTEHELTAIDGERTGCVRRSQWIRRTMRYQAVPPSERGDAPFTSTKAMVSGRLEIPTISGQ